MELSSSVRLLKGVGDRMESLLASLGIYTVRDLLTWYPRAYEEQTGLHRAGELVPSLEGETITLLLHVDCDVTQRFVKKLRIAECSGSDETGSIRLRWINRPYIRNVVHRGSTCYFRGSLKARGSSLYLSNPRILSQQQYEEMSSGILPVYPLTKGLTAPALQKLVRQALSQIPAIRDYLAADLAPGGFLEGSGLEELGRAINDIHFAPGREDLIRARRRLAFDEFLFFMLEVRSLKSGERPANGCPLTCRELSDRLISFLPYELTGAQKRAVEEIYSDVTGPFYMNRLIQGDVGCGKTAVAFAAMFFALGSGYQSALMAPTEVLARQHWLQLRGLLQTAGMDPELCVYLAGSLTEKEKRKARERIASGSAMIAVGTHALIQDGVAFYRPGLVVTDEQHRFGVKQRLALSAPDTASGREEEGCGNGSDIKQDPAHEPEQEGGAGGMVHTLVMSATPIPRTLAVILYGDLDISVIDQLPAGRLPIKNCVVGPSFRRKSCEFIADQVSQGRQALVICPMVEQSDSIEAEDVTGYAQKLKASLPEGISIEILHGRMKGSEKNDIMDRFASGAIQVLVSTTVVEVGVNVPNTTVMMVENAERFGLAQLHQLRGRVGRGEHQSYCIFMCSSDRPESRSRLDILSKSNDGFRIAEEDLKQRGPGDLFGVRQSGELAFRIGDIYADAGELKLASEYADHIMASGGIASYGGGIYEEFRRRDPAPGGTAVL